MGAIPDIQEVHQHFDNLVQVSGTASASTVLSNGDSATFIMTTNSNSGGILNGVPDVTLYLGSVADANKIPDGISIDMSLFQVMGPFTDWGDASANKNDIKTKIYIRNISAGASQTIVFRGWCRTIVNSLSNLGASS